MSVMGALFSFCVGAHGWVARICQPWEQSKSPLLLVEAAWCRSKISKINSGNLSALKTKFPLFQMKIVNTTQRKIIIKIT